ncbi:MAG TPA: adenylate/guanylate cyclase domain-containing protein [Burkholderiales bacterium]|nr:adenylate/guanylate cyclase domain-containing protein [Burkholderiales bacterium]
MKCDNCQSENPAGNKLCSVCGMPLALLCRKCNHANSPGSRYCSMCGHFLADAPATDRPASPDPPPATALMGERRQVTVMFCDLSGYTSMTERLDPEEVDDVLSRIKRAAARVIERHGGTINQFIGDEVMALFGIPHGEDDDPVRAIKAALALHAEIRDKMGDLRARIGEHLAVHTGISSGLVVAHYRNDREGLYQLTGDTVTSAARLRSLAGTDEILIGPSTQRLARPYFALEPRPPVSVKGKALPLVPYRVVAESRISSRFEAARERGFKSYVGRVRELEMLRSCLGRALAGEGQLVTVEGEPGIGKSRLLYEFLHGVDLEQIIVSRAACQSHGSETPYFPFLDSMRRGLQLSEHDNQADTLRRAVANIKWIDPSLESSLPLLLHLLSIPSDYALPTQLTGEALRHALEEALVGIITLTTKVQPMVLLIEDWHWSDAASQSALHHLLRRLPACRLMVVVSYRSGYGFDFGQIGCHTAIRLDPLNEAEAEDLIRTVTGATSLPAGLGALICQSTDGNPLFVEEACYSLLESGTVSLVDRRLILHQRLDQLLLPDTVQAVIRARLDRLDDHAKAVVGSASVIGRVFNQRILARIDPGRSSLEQSLEVLQAQEIIRQTKAAPEPEYSFRHVLTREVAYDALLHQQRKQLHEAVGLAIEELYPDRLGENVSILAYHYARSARADKAVQYALLAGERAARLYANAEAAAHFDDALAIAKSVPESPQSQSWQIDAILGQLAVGTAPRDMERDRSNLEHAYALAQKLNDRRRLAQVLYWLGRHHYVLAELERAIEYAGRSQEIADELGDAALAAPPINLMGRAYWQLSDFVRSAQMMERSVEQMRLLGNKSEESTAAGFVSALFGYMGEFDTALSYSNRSIKLARDLKNPYAEAASFHYRGIIRDQQGQWDLALADYATALKIAEAAGDMFRVYIVKFMQGRAHYMDGDLTRARSLVEDSIALASRIGTTFLLGQAKCFLAACCFGQAGAEDARSLCAEALSLAEKAGDKFTEALVLRTLAEGVSLTGVPPVSDEARRAILTAIQLQERIGATPELARSYLSLACIVKAAGNSGEASSYLGKAMHMFKELEMSWDIARATEAFERDACQGT